jgi:hypothetical protein
MGLRPTDHAFPAWEISLGPDMTADITLRWIISRATVSVDLQTNLLSGGSVANFQWDPVCRPINSEINQ